MMNLIYWSAVTWHMSKPKIGMTYFFQENVLAKNYFMRVMFSLLLQILTFEDV